MKNLADADMPCVFCGRVSRRTHLEAFDADTGTECYVLETCERCRSGRLLDPPSAGRLARAYDESYYGSGIGKFRAPVQWLFEFSTRRLAARLLRDAGAAGVKRALDIGCGRGVLLRALAAHGVETWGVERHAVAVSGARVLIDGDLEDPRLETGTFDLVVLWHSLEHMEDSELVLSHCHRLMSAGGQIVIAVPNNASWQARLFGARWFHLDLPRHLVFIGSSGLECMLARSGFRIRRTSTFHVLQNLYGFVQSALNALVPRRPNRLYALLRSVRSRAVTVELLLWLLLGALLLPAGLAELVLASLCRRGASCIVYASKSTAAGSR